MAFQVFSENLEYTLDLGYKLVVLHDPEDIVKLSSFAQKSISYLDLQLCRPFEGEEFYEVSSGARNYNPTKSHFIITEEQCRKILTPNRSLLYDLHLDLAKGREWGLNSGRGPRSFSRNTSLPHIAKITPSVGFEIRTMYEFLKEALKVTSDKLKILEGLLKIKFLKEYFISFLEPRISNQFIDCFYSGSPRPELLKDFISHFDLSLWLKTCEEPEKLNYLLYHIHYEGIRFFENGLVDSCFVNRVFRNIRPFLNFKHTPEFYSYDYKQYISKISSVRPAFTEELFTTARSWMRQKRIHLLLQIIWMYRSVRRSLMLEHFKASEASEALGLLWRSVPDAFISFTEILKTLRGVFRAKEMVDMHNFYCKAVGEFHLNTEPRSLKHFCRTSIRKALWKRGNWLPEGIKKIGVSDLLQSFLNLEI